MKIRNIGIATLLVTGAIALAQNDGAPEAWVGHGRGAAASADRRQANFNFEVVKSKNREGKVVVRGRSEFRQIANQNGRRVDIVIRAVDEVAFDGTIVRFAGNAVLETVVDGKPKRFEGRSQVMGNDQNRPNGDGNKKDLYRIHFKAKNANLDFTFEGAVREGDIVVKKRDGGGGN